MPVSTDPLIIRTGNIKRIRNRMRKLQAEQAKLKVELADELAALQAGFEQYVNGPAAETAAVTDTPIEG